MIFKNNLIGCVQGRLTPSPDGSLQRFPDNWQNEYSIAKKIGLDFLEILVEREHNQNNPFWDEQKRDELIFLSKKNHLNIHSVCLDFVINHSLLNDKECQNYWFLFLENCKKINVKKIILPLMEESHIGIEELMTLKNILKESISLIKDSKINIFIEANNDAYELKGFLKEINEKKIGCVFDTGNRILQNVDLIEEYSILEPFIGHIHLKDRDKDDKNTLLGTGRVDFKSFFKSLKKFNYDGAFVFETYKGEDPVKIMKSNLRHIKLVSES